MVVIPVADGVDVCGFECLILEVALKHGINRCTFADAKWASPDNHEVAFWAQIFRPLSPGTLE